MPGSSTSAAMRCVGFTRSGWCINWIRSPTSIAPHRTRVRGLIWDFYVDLKAYQLKPGKRRASALRARFDRIFLRRTGFATLDRLLARLHANKAELLMVLDPVEKSRCTPTVRKTTFAARSRGERSAQEHGATSAGTVAMPSTQSHQDLRQARHRALGLPGQQVQRDGKRDH